MELTMRRIARWDILGMVWSWSVTEVCHYTPPIMAIDGPPAPPRPRLPMTWTIAEGYAFTEKHARRKAHRAIRREERLREFPSYVEPVTY